MTEQRGVSQCDQCGDFDDHPKAHWNDGGTYHHDCIPFKLRQELIEAAPHVQSIIDAAESGTRGPALREYIAQLHKES